MNELIETKIKNIKQQREHLKSQLKEIESPKIKEMLSEKITICNREIEKLEKQS
ncbi:hypothetical protein MHZ36_12640 [Staphylococcus sp. ACRSN]|uniref:hypothetical protein n=1 Tax=Staphylococcus sp. ACRSN TaxID=2918214 RepID=UPI001EF321C9|nr:hypothetical protein [Staphylococcus sp. ACRSN]MCG7340136.1 hypothetical protein [Staphylococcus sp. ACRSN]